MTYINEAGLLEIRKNKYNTSNKSILYHHVMKYIWDFAIEFVPRWIAPNSITLTGFCGLFINCLLVIYYNPFSGQSLPPWLYLLSAFCLFSYSLLDNLDGRQARRTGTASPLGQLFDHGCDALVMTLLNLIIVAIFRLTPAMCFWQTITSLSLFYLATWEEFHTGVLKFGYINGPDDGIVMIISLFLVPFFSSDFFVTPVSELVGFHFFGWKVNQLMWYLSLFQMGLTAVSHLTNVRFYLKQNKKSVIPAVRHLLSFSIFSGSAVVWYFLQPDFWITNAIPIYLTYGLCFGEIVGRLIVGHLCLQDVYFIQRPVIPLLCMVANALGQFLIGTALVNQDYLFYGYILATLASYLHYVLGITKELCASLKISCFTIVPKREE